MVWKYYPALRPIKKVTEKLKIIRFGKCEAIAPIPPVNQGKVCVKGATVIDAINKDRLLYPMVRDSLDEPRADAITASSTT